MIPTCVDDRSFMTVWPPRPIWSPFELGVVTEFARALPRRKVFLEIGSYRGGSALHFAREVMEPGALLLCIDLPDGFGGGKRFWMDLLKVRQMLRDDGFEARTIRGESQKVVEDAKEILAGRPVDVLLIDGDHRQGCALRDWMTYSPLLDGLGIFHDCGVTDGRCAFDAGQQSFLAHTRAGFFSAAAGHRYLTVQEDFGTGLIWREAPKEENR